MVWVLFADELNQQQADNHEEHQSCGEVHANSFREPASVFLLFAALDLANDGKDTDRDEEGDENGSDNVFHGDFLSFSLLRFDAQSFRQALRST